MDDVKDELSRRIFLQGLGAALSCPLLASCEFVEVFDAEAGEEVNFALSDPEFAGLEEVGSTACIEAGELDLLLIRKDQQTVIAVERFCPHQELNMGPCDDNPQPAVWDADKQQLTCRWHLSVFDVDGQVVSGPSPRSLRLYPVDFDPQSGQGTVLAGSGRGVEQ
ncbi:MAG: Rieske (2Fe-2S) protein [Persicimonas sp.]